MILERREMHQVAFQLESGHAITNRFFRVGRSFSDRGPHFLQSSLDLGWEAGDVFVDVHKEGCVKPPRAQGPQG